MQSDLKRAPECPTGGISAIMRVAIVVPTIREQFISDFLNAWRDEFREALIFIVEDNPSRQFDLTSSPNVCHFSWEEIDEDLGSESWIIPRRTDCIRSYGYYKAYQQGADMIVTLDDDCYPNESNGEGFIERHWSRLSSGGQCEAWSETASGVPTRGLPYFNRTRRWPVAINHGMWTGVPDLDAPTQLVSSRSSLEFHFENQTIPVGMYFPMCGMNLAFRREVVPAMYFMLMGRDYEYDRFGDIWAGIVVKKVCDHLGYAVTSGEPAVAHRRASNVWSNLRKEVAGLEVNEEFWQRVDRAKLTQTTFSQSYKELVTQLDLEGEYWERLRQAMLTWADLIEEIDQFKIRSSKDDLEKSKDPIVAGISSP